MRAHPNPIPTRCSGFTLMELLVAVAIFAMIGSIAYQGLQSVLDTNAALEQQTARASKLQRLFFTLQNDFLYAAPREVRGQYGDPMSPFSGSGGGQFLFEFTRAGRRNPAQLARSAMQRVAYGVVEDQLQRAIWIPLDQAQDSEAQITPMLDDVVQVEIRYLDHQREWQSSWPPPTSGVTAPSANLLPLAAEVAIDTKDLGRITRLFRLGGPL